MWGEAAQYAADTGAGIFAVLFILLLGTVAALVKWVLNTNNQREQRYIDVIDKQAEAIKEYHGNIKHDLNDIKKMLYAKGGPNA